MQSGKEKTHYVREMFARIAGNYDLMNRLMTGGQDIRWRRELIEKCELQPENRLLDLGTGTGDLALEAHRQLPTIQTVGGDLTIQMMQVGRTNTEKQSIQWVVCDASELPFNDQQFDVVVSGFLLRNVADLQITLKEQYRVLKPGGKVASLDTTHPPAGLISPVIKFYLYNVIPLLGSLVSGDLDAYRYLPESTSRFLRAEELAERFAQAGFVDIRFTKKMLGTIAIHWAQKPKNPLGETN